MEDLDLAQYLRDKGLDVHRAHGDEVVTHCLWCPDGDLKGRGKLYLNTELWLYDCKRCGTSGNRRTLLQHFGDDDPVAFTPGEDPGIRRQIMAEYVSHAEELLANNDATLTYLLKRGLSPETIESARLGYVPRGYGISTSLPTDFSRAALISSGLLTDTGKEYFQKRIIIPYVASGAVVQIRGKDVDGKYFSTPGSNARLYNVDALRDADKVIITEGEFDALILQQFLGDSPEATARSIAVIGLPGANSIPDNIDIQLGSVKRVYIGLDNDDTGRAAAVKLKAKLGSKSRIMELPREVSGRPIKDWTDYLQHGENDWRDIMRLVHEADMTGKRIYSMQEAGARWEKNQVAVPGVKTGFPTFDAIIKPGLRPGNLMIPLAKTGTGKALRDDMPVLTASGWLPIGSLVPGEQVYGSDGQLHNVIGVYPQGERDLFRCTFSDGAEVICDDEHLWTYRTQGGDNARWQTATLAEIRKLRRVYVPVAEPMAWPERDLPVEPYLLGVLLGDACLRTTSIVLTTDDEIVKHLDLPEGVEPRRIGDNGPGVGDYRLSGVQGKDNPLSRALKNLGLWGQKSITKHIPAEYLTASVDQRLSLLSGLFDTDGSVDRRTGSVEFATSSPQLAQDVQALIASLGGVCRVRERTTTHENSYRLTPILPAALGAPFRLPRKAMLWTPSRRPTRRLVSVESAGRDLATCIAVDAPDQLFITAGHVVTHNTLFLSNLAYNMRAHRVLFITLEMMADEIYAILRKISRFHNPGLDDREIQAQMPHMRIVDENRLSPEDFALLIEEYIEEVGERPEVVYVDYLGYYSKGQKGNGSYEKTSNAVMQLKEEAKRHEVAIVAPHQVNRNAKEGKPLDADEARDSGVVEETADFLVGLFKPSEAVDDTTLAPGKVNGALGMSILKSRRGGKGKVVQLHMSMASLVIVDDVDRKAVARIDQENAALNRGLTYEDLYREQRVLAHEQAQLRLVKDAG